MAIVKMLIGGFGVIPEDCPDCDGPLYDSACDAPGCHGRGCQECGWGCDFDFTDDGHCSQAAAAEDPADRAARIEEERAAFGLDR